MMNRPVLFVGLFLLLVAGSLVVFAPSVVEVDGASQLFDVSCSVPVRNVAFFDLDIAQDDVRCSSEPSTLFGAFSFFSDSGDLVMKIGSSRDSVNVKVWENGFETYALIVKNVQAGERSVFFTLYDSDGVIVESFTKKVSVG